MRFGLPLRSKAKFASDLRRCRRVNLRDAYFYSFHFEQAFNAGFVKIINHSPSAIFFENPFRDFKNHKLIWFDKKKHYVNCLMLKEHKI